tara:strand:- start:4998 stop:5276 length:279 start_codon:yes stop_codon:yes gene_type:complete
MVAQLKELVWEPFRVDTVAVRAEVTAAVRAAATGVVEAAEGAVDPVAAEVSAEETAGATCIAGDNQQRHGPVRNSQNCRLNSHHHPDIYHRW